MDFQVGDRVVAIEENAIISKGDTGVVCHISEGFDNIGVCWDAHSEHKHNCQGHCHNGFGFYVSPESITQVNPSIYTRKPFPKLNQEK